MLQMQKSPAEARVVLLSYRTVDKSEQLIKLAELVDSPPRAPERLRLRFFSALTVSTRGTRMENNHRHGDTGCSVPVNTHTHTHSDHHLCHQHLYL